MKSVQAQAAAQIRKELKANGIPAKVRSESYAGGCSVSVTLINPLPATAEKVTAFVKQYQYGTFDGMTDSYDYTNRREDIPQVTFAQVYKEFTSEFKEAARQYAETNYEKEGSIQGAADMYGPESVPHQILCGSVDCGFWTTHKPRIAA